MNLITHARSHVCACLLRVRATPQTASHIQARRIHTCTQKCAKMAFTRLHAPCNESVVRHRSTPTLASVTLHARHKADESGLLTLTTSIPKALCQLLGTLLARRTQDRQNVNISTTHRTPVPWPPQPTSQRSTRVRLKASTCTYLLDSLPPCSASAETWCCIVCACGA
jgi:hypothetical protein